MSENPTGQHLGAGSQVLECQDRAPPFSPLRPPPPAPRGCPGNSQGHRVSRAAGAQDTESILGLHLSPSAPSVQAITCCLPHHPKEGPRLPGATLRGRAGRGSPLHPPGPIHFALLLQQPDTPHCGKRQVTVLRPAWPRGESTPRTGKGPTLLSRAEKTGCNSRLSAPPPIS